jgi:hypothetical protein
MIAELIAQEYYPCLREATVHPTLRRICDKIICDEVAHIRFQVERIARIEARHHRGVVVIRDWLQIGLMFGTAFVVFRGHHRVLRTRLTLAAFVRAVVRRNFAAIEAMRALRGRVPSPAETAPAPLRPRTRLQPER